MLKITMIIITLTQSRCKGSSSKYNLLNEVIKERVMEAVNSDGDGCGGTQLKDSIYPHPHRL